MERLRNEEAGFTLLEMLISVSVFMVVAAIAFTALNGAQKQYRSMEMRMAMEERMRAALELMTQEIGQAGLPGLGMEGNALEAPLATVTAHINASGVDADGSIIPSALPVDSTAGMTVGEVLTVDSGAKSETVMVTGLTATSVTGHFTQAHDAGAAIYALGVFPAGILPSSLPTGGATTSTVLDMFGDLKNVRRSLIRVKYQCPANYPGAFTRTEISYDVATAAVSSSTMTLVDNVTACSFSYLPAASLPTTDNFQPGSTAVQAGSVDNSDLTPICPGGYCNYTMIPGVGISITAESQSVDPATGKTFKLTKSFLNIQPRNILAAMQEIASGADPNTAELQTFKPGWGIFSVP